MGAMEYKLYFLDDNGRIGQRIDLECAKDEHAVERAVALSDRRAMELWRGPRMIKAFAEASAVRRKPAPPLDGQARGPLARPQTSRPSNPSVR